MKATMEQQAGFSFSGFIVMAVLLVSAAIYGMKIIPSYMENGKIQKAMDAIVRDPSLQTATVAEIKDSFAKRAVTMDNVTSISENDLVISKAWGRLSLSASYSVKIPVAGNASLLIEFNPSASQ